MTTPDPGATTRATATERRSSISLTQAARTFTTRPQPWLLVAAVAIAVTARGLHGGYAWSDLYLVVGYLAAWPLVEWVVHTSLLHWKPREVAGRTIDPLVARKHREHHVDPQQLDLIFIPVPALLTVAAGIAALVWVLPTRIGLTFAVVATTVGLVYEWLHYLVHTDYRPRSAPYRALWRHHRLHHYKNENYWFTVTTASTADRVLHTQPDPSDVPNSPTARDLLGTGGR
ncbi:sterol desaturase family protein [Nitriliruptor alkaliphilus]|uniref:sterol desaturase family protein n=1 Tax=Nitriliruptor alkaliphilus TaxID=427918 RepID=UPI000697B576|nr:sterol desaturase family protein [Nitriliruptor alkaliphilus]